MKEERAATDNLLAGIFQLSLLPPSPASGLRKLNIDLFLPLPYSQLSF
jgi:hypothetical protein